MSEKTVIEVDVKDESFQRFKEAFHEFEQSLDEMPNGWSKVDQAIGSTGTAMGGANRQATKFSRTLHKLDRAQHSFGSALGTGSRGLGVFGGMAKAAGDGLIAMAGGIGLVITGIAAIGVAAAKATISLDKLTAAKFKSSKEVGLTMGQQTTFNTYGSQLFANPEEMLAKMRDAKLNYLDRTPLYHLGITNAEIDKDNAAQLSMLYASKAKAYLHTLPIGARGLIATQSGMQIIGGTSEVSLLDQTKSAQIAKYNEEYNKHIASANISTGTGQRAVDTTMRVEQLKNRLTADAENFAGSRVATTAATAIIHGVKDTMGGADKVVGLVHMVAGKVILWQNSGATAAASRAGLQTQNELQQGTSRSGIVAREALPFIRQIQRASKLTGVPAAAIAGEAYAESTFNQNPKNGNTVGIMQVTPGTWKEFGGGLPYSDASNVQDDLIVGARKMRADMKLHKTSKGQQGAYSGLSGNALDTYHGSNMIGESGFLQALKMAVAQGAKEGLSNTHIHIHNHGSATGSKPALSIHAAAH